MPNYGTRIVKIVNGHRVMEYIEVVPNYKVTFLGSPADIIFQVGADIYSRNQIALFPEGTYSYSARVSGDDTYGVKNGAFTVSDGDVVVSEDLVKQNYTISVHAESLEDATLEGVSIYLNDRLLGVTDANGNLVSSAIIGQYNLIGRKEGFFAATATIDLNSNKSISLLLSSTSSNPSDPGNGNGVVSFTSSPSGASIYINGVLSGVTPSTAQLPANNYMYSLKKSGYRDYIGNFRVDSGSVTSVSAALVPLLVGSNLSITSNVTGAQISNIETGEIYGYTPLQRNVQGNRLYKFVARKAGYQDKYFDIYAQEAQTHDYYAELSIITNYPERGLLAETYCQGYDKYGKYHDGTGGFYIELIEANSLTCGYPINARVTVEDGVISSTIYVYNMATLTTPLPAAGADLSSLPTPTYTFTKNARTTVIDLPRGSYTMVSVPTVALATSDTRTPVNTVSYSSPISISSTTQYYYVNILNYKEVRITGNVVITSSVVNGVLTDYFTRDSTGITGWNVTEQGKTLYIQPYIRLSTVGNPGSSNGTHTITTQATYSRKYSPLYNTVQTPRNIWDFSTIVQVVPTITGKEASVTSGTIIATPTVTNNASFNTNGGNTIRFSYYNVNSTSNATVEFRFSVSWWESEI